MLHSNQTKSTDLLEGTITRKLQDFNQVKQKDFNQHNNAKNTALFLTGLNSERKMMMRYPISFPLEIRNSSTPLLQKLKVVTSHYHGTTYAKCAGTTGETAIRKCVIDFIKPNVTISSLLNMQKNLLSAVILWLFLTSGF